MKDFGTILSEEMEKQDITIKSLSERTKICGSTIAKYKRGEADPPLSKAIDILHDLGIGLYITKKKRKEAH